LINQQFRCVVCYKKGSQLLSKNKFSVVSIFSGCGGSSLGYKLAGGNVLCAVEHWKDAVDSYRMNFSDTSVLHMDIRDCTVNQILNVAKLKVGELDVFDGSPPCQGFSTAGKRVTIDHRNWLFDDYIRLLDGLQPRVAVMENVPGLLTGKMRLMFDFIVSKIQGCGYSVTARILNAVNYGVPQLRKRVFIVSVRKDIKNTFVWPTPCAKNTCLVGDALDGVSHEDTPKLSGKYGNIWNRVPIGGDARNVFGSDNARDSCIKIDPTTFCRTIYAMQGGNGFATMVHWAEPRPLSISECKRLCGFPDDFRLVGTYQNKWKQLGNSVMPPVAKCIGNAIFSSVLGDFL